MERMLRNLVKTCFDHEASLSPECNNSDRGTSCRLAEMSFKQQFTVLQCFSIYVLMSDRGLVGQMFPLS